MFNTKQNLLSRLKTEGFLFFYDDMPKSLAKDFFSLKYEEIVCEPGKDLSRETNNIPTVLLKKVKRWLNSNEQIKTLTHPLNFSAHTFRKGEFINLHSDSLELGDYQILIWICRDDKFMGRDFIYGFRIGTQEFLKQIKPKTGLICVMDMTNHNFIHGVSKLESDTEIVTICGCFAKV